MQSLFCICKRLNIEEILLFYMLRHCTKKMCVCVNVTIESYMEHCRLWLSCSLSRCYIILWQSAKTMERHKTYLGTIKLVVRTRDLGAVGLVSPVSTVLKKRNCIDIYRMIFIIQSHLVSVTAPPCGNTQTVLTPELSTMARREIWKEKLQPLVHLPRHFSLFVFAQCNIFRR